MNKLIILMFTMFLLVISIVFAGEGQYELVESQTTDNENLAAFVFAKVNDYNINQSFTPPFDIKLSALNLTYHGGGGTGDNQCWVDLYINGTDTNLGSSTKVDCGFISNSAAALWNFSSFELTGGTAYKWAFIHNMTTGTNIAFRIGSVSGYDGGCLFQGAGCSIYDFVFRYYTDNRTVAVAPVISNLYDVTGAGTNKTSDITSTINLTTDIAATCNISTDNSTWFGFTSGSGTTKHQGTVDATDPLSIGHPQNVTSNCTASGLSAYATIVYNITDGTPATIVLDQPPDNAIFEFGINNTIQLNFTATDNFFSTLDCNLTINGVLNQTDNSVTSGAKTSWTSITFGVDSYDWNVSCIDGHDNANSTQSTLTVSDTIVPTITIQSPVNNSVHYTSSVDLNWTTDETLEWCAYNLDGGENDTSICYINETCYQETANVSTACGGRDTGKYYCENTWDATNSCNLTYDGDLSTFGYPSDTGTLYINYSKPTYAISLSKWQVKDAGGITNLTIPSNCWSQEPLQFKAYLDGGAVSVHWSCFNSSVWNSLRFNDLAFIVHEEAMWWYIYNVTNITLPALSDGLHNVTIYGNDTYGNMGQSPYTYFSVVFPPTWSNNQTNILGTKYGDTFWISVDWTDNEKVNYSWLSIQNSSGWYNLTPFAINAISGTHNTTYIMDETRGFLWNWTFYANDTVNNLNQTDIWNYEVANAPPTINETPTNQQAYNGLEFNYDLNGSDIEGDTITYYLNDTSIFSIHSANGTINGTPIEADIGTRTYNFTVGDGFDNTSALFNITVNDITAPRYYDNQSNTTSPKINEYVAINVTVNDTNEGQVWSSNNFTGDWINETPFNYVSGVGVSNVTQVTKPRGNNICYIWYFNDSSNNLNQSLVSCMAVDNTIPIIKTDLRFSNASAGHIFNVSFEVTDADGGSDIDTATVESSSGTCLFYQNSTSGNDFKIEANCSGTALQQTTIRINITDKGGATINSSQKVNTYPNKAPNQVTAWTTPSSTPFYSSSNITFNWTSVLDNDSDTVYYQFYTNLTQTVWQVVYNNTLSNWTSNFTIDGNYTYVVGTYDGFEYGINSTERIFVFDTSTPSIEYAGGTADNNSVSVITWIYVNVSVIEIHFSNVSFYLFNSSFDNINTTTTTSLNINFTGLDDGKYYYNVTARDKASNEN